jgi:hypothetical protein
MAAVRGLDDPLRKPLRSLIAEASHLDGLLTFAPPLSKPPEGLLKEELEDLLARLADATDQVEAALGRPKAWSRRG